MASLILHPERLEHEAPALALAAVPRGTITERLHVYLDGYPARLHDALVETFPAVAHMIGHGAMTHLTRRYLGALSLESYNLNDAGAELPAFLRADELTTQLPFLADLAELEWDIACAFHAHDESPLDPSVLTSWTLDDWEGARLRFQPSVALVCSPWPIRELWEARETPIEAIALDVHDRPDRVLVYRTGLAECCESVDSAEAAALESLLDGHTLAAVTAHLAAHGHDPAAVSAWFTRWMSQGMIRGCDRGVRDE